MSGKLSRSKSFQNKCQTLRIQDREKCGDYILIELIGHGGYGSVYKGLHLLKGNFLAIKKISLLSKNITEDNLNSFMTEISLLQRLRHQNIVQYIDHVVTNKHIYIVMEYMSMGSLANMVKTYGVFPEPLAIVYVKQILVGLNYLHEEGVIHRDIKGANILISTEGSIKLADFGVATQLSDQNSDNYGGTPYWMAPEVIKMQGVTTACDIWSLGCTIIELITGHPPYHDLPQVTALYAIVNDDHPPLPEGISQSLRDFLMRCFQKDENLRIDAVKLLQHSWIKTNHSYQNIEKLNHNIADVQKELSLYKKKLEEVDRKVEETAYPSLVLKNKNIQQEENKVTNRRHSLPSQPSNILNIQNSQVNSFTLTNINEKLSLKNNKLIEKIQPEDDNSIDMNKNHSNLSTSNIGSVGLILGKRFSKYEDNNEDFLDGIELNNKPTHTLKLISQEIEWDDEIEETFEEFPENLLHEKYRDQLQRDIISLIQQLNLNESSVIIIKASKQLTEIFKHNPNEKVLLITKNGITSILDQFSYQKNEEVILYLLKLINQVINDKDIQEAICLQGGLPYITDFTQNLYSKEIRIEVSKFVKCMCSTTVFNLQMFLACKGYSILTNLLETNYKEFHEIIHTCLDAIIKIFKLQTHIPKNAFCHSFAKTGLIERLANSLMNIQSSKNRHKKKHGIKKKIKKLNLSVDLQQYFLKICTTFLFFSQADSLLVKQNMCKKEILTKINGVMNRIIDSINENQTISSIIRDSILKLLKVIKNLAMDPKNRDSLEDVGIIETMVKFLKIKVGIERLQEIHNQALNCLFCLCELNKKRQEKAALAGIIIHLHEIIKENSSLKGLALSIFFHLLHASQLTRNLLWESSSLEIYISLLSDNSWYTDAMESIAAWLSYEPKKLEPVLQKEHFIQKLKEIFHFSKKFSFSKVLQSLLKIISRSTIINKLLSEPSIKFIPLLLETLETTSQPFSRILLLKIINSLFLYSNKKSEINETFQLSKVIKKIAEKDYRVTQMTEQLLENITNL